MLVSYHPSLAGVRSLDWSESVTIAGEVGFDLVDLDLRQVVGVDPTEIKERLDAAGVRSGAASLPAELRGGDDLYEESVSLLRRVAPLAAEIGIGVMHRSLPASHDQSASELRTLLLRRWRDCAAILRGHGIIAAVEPLGTPYRRHEGAHEFICSFEAAADFAVACGEGVGVLVDSWHWHLAGGTAADIAEIRGLIAHVHVADVPDLSPDTLRDDERVLPGEGVVDFDAFVGALAASGYEGMVAPEVPGSWSAALDPLDAARHGLAATHTALRSSGGGGGG